MTTRLLHELVRILEESGGWLLLGFALAGAAKALIPMGFMRKHLGGTGMKGVLKGALVGVPLPVCSCAVIPLAASIRKHGASKGAAASFAIATPETGPDTIALTWGLIGPVLAIVRPIGAFLAGVIAGTLINLTKAQDDSDELSPGAVKVSAYCCDVHAIPRRGAIAHCSCVDDCAGNDCALDEVRQSTGVLARVTGAVRYGFVELPMDIALWLLAGLLATAIIGALAPPMWIEQHLGGGVVPMLLVLAAGLPMYVCASASTPVVAMLIAKGLSPGAALVFLLAGSATNLATMSWVIKDLGARALVIYLGSISAVSIALGVAIDALWPHAGAAAASLAADAGHDEGGWRLALGLIAATVLVAGAVMRVVKRLQRR